MDNAHANRSVMVKSADQMGAVVRAGSATTINTAIPMVIACVSQSATIACVVTMGAAGSAGVHAQMVKRVTLPVIASAIRPFVVLMYVETTGVVELAVLAMTVRTVREVNACVSSIVLIKSVEKTTDVEVRADAPRDKIAERTVNAALSTNVIIVMVVFVKMVVCVETMVNAVLPTTLRVVIISVVTADVV